MTLGRCSVESCGFRSWPAVKVIALIWLRLYWLFDVRSGSAGSRGGSVVASGLQGPRGLTFGPDGLLYVAEAGTGGTQPAPAGCTNVVGPVGPYHGGLTARVSRIESNGTRTTVIDNLPSSISALPSGDTEGVADVAFVDGQLYAVTAGGGCSHGNPNFPNSVIRINVKHGTGEIIANLSKFFLANPVAHPNDGPLGRLRARRCAVSHEGVSGRSGRDGAEPRENPSHQHRRARAGDRANQRSVGALGALRANQHYQRDNRFYVGNLGFFPIVVGSSKLYQVTHDGFVIDYWAGFTTVVDTHVDSKGRIYVLELSSAAGNPGLGNGRVIRITGKLVEEVVSGLDVPTAMALDCHDDIYVSDLGAAPPGAGRILRFDNPVSGTVITTIEVRKPAPLKNGND